MKKFILGIALVAFLMAGCATTAPVATTPAAPAATTPAATTLAPLAKDVAITIVHTNDMHARGLETKTEIGYSRIAGYVNALKAKGENVLLLDAGDTFHGLPWANLDRGAAVVQLMNAAGYDAMTTGNHDYNYGYQRLVELAGMTKFPVLLANVYKDGVRLFTPYIIKNVDGVRVAIFGLATQETLYKSDPKGLQGLVFENPVAEARRLIQNELDGKYDVLICLSHIGIDASSDPIATNIAESLPEIDVIIDGHSHSSLDQEKALNKTNVLVVSADSYGQTLGKIDLVVGKDRKIIKKEPVSLNLTNNAAELVSDPTVKKVADDIVAAQAPMLAEVVGQTAINLEGKREIVRTSETNLGRLIANGMLYTTGADIALMNGGGIRDSIPAGPITKKQVYTVLPFGNYLWTTVLKGSELKAVIENGVGKLPAPDGRYPHFAGLSFSCDPSQPVGSRVSNIMVKGVPVDPAKNYTFAALNFQMNGGDEYTMLTGRSYKEYPMDADSFMSYLKKIGTVTEASIPYTK